MTDRSTIPGFYEKRLIAHDARNIVLDSAGRKEDDPEYVAIKAKILEASKNKRMYVHVDNLTDILKHWLGDEGYTFQPLPPSVYSSLNNINPYIIYWNRY
jgi:hypothetical protein